MSTETAPPAPTLAALYAALARAIARAQAVGKEAKNTHHNYKYASAEGLIGEAREALAAEGLCVITLTWWVVPRDAEDGQQAAGYFGDLKVKYIVAHQSGATLECETETPALRDRGRPEDKAVATALTYNLGYFLRGLLLLPRVDADHDVDQRDDRNYEPQRTQQRGNGGRDQRQSDRRDDRGGPANEQRQPAGKPVDVTAALLAISAATTEEKLKEVGRTFEGAQGADRAKIEAAYVQQRDKLRAATPVDKEWAAFLAELGQQIKADCSGWTEEDVGADFDAVLKDIKDRNEANVRAMPWIATAAKHRGAAVKRLREAITRMFDDRVAQLVAASGRRGAA